MFEFRLRTHVIAGAGVAQELPSRLSEWKATRIALIVDSGVSSSQPFLSLLDGLRDGFPDVQLESSDVAEPDYDYLDSFRNRFSNAPDVIVGIGGGSVLDLAKAISVLVTNAGPAINYRGFELVRNPGVPVVAIPTTAGTGSEITPNAVFTDRREMRKFGINSHLYLPRLAVLDPLFTLSCPCAVTVSAGVDALVHSVESYVARGASPLTRPLSLSAFSIVVKNLPKVVDDPNNIDARAQMQVGALYAAAALMNSGAGPAGAMSYPLGVHFRVPHGLAGGVFLARVAEHNVARGAHAYHDLYRLMEGSDPELTPERGSRAFCEMLTGLLDRIGVPSTLGALGVQREHVAILSEETLLLSGALSQNPVAFGAEDARRILADMTTG